MRGWLVMVCVLLWAASARAGNDDAFFQGNEAAMQGGAVAATGTSAGQLWYNPGALALGQGNRIELSGSLFTLRFRELDPYMELAAPDGSVVASNRERSVDFLSVPSALSYTRRIGSRVRAGIGVFVQRQDSVDLENTLRWDDGAGSAYAYRRSLKFDQQRLFAGPGLSVALGKLSLGASLFFVYEQSAYEEISSLFVTGPTVAAATEEYRVDVRRYGLELVLGAHLQVSDRVHAGLVLRGPRFRLAETLSLGRVGTESIATPTGAQVATADEPPFEFRSGRVIAAPARLVFALGYVTGDLTLAAEVDVAHRYGGFEDYLWTYNFRAGATVRVAETVKLGVGFFTDRANVASSNSAFQSFLDYYGGNLALSTATPVGVRRDDGDESTPDRLVFHSTVSLRYAAGVGSGSGAIALSEAIDDDASVGVFLFGEEQRFLVHEVALYIGSGLDF